MSHRRVQNKSDELSCTVSVARYGPQSVASARRELFVPKLQYSLSIILSICLSITEYIGKTTNKFITSQ